MTPLELSCKDFTRNSDGSWSPVTSVAIGTFVFGPAISFRSGDLVSGIDVAKWLDEHCFHSGTVLTLPPEH